MSILKRAWTFASYAATGYAIYRQLKSLDQAKEELYSELPAPQKEQWEKIFGKPGAVTVANPDMPKVVLAQKDVAESLEQVNAGT